MSIRTMWTVALLILTVGSGLLAQAPAGTSGPLPPGHPPIRPAGPASMPEGAVLPAGHPPLPGAALPAGHPPIGAAAPATQPDAKGALIVRVVQGTKDAPAVGDAPITVELFLGEQPVKKLEAMLDAKGVAILEDLPVPAAGVQPVVSMTYGGVSYRQASREPMTPEQADQQIRLTVYETTEQAPPWRVRMRHVEVYPTRQGGLYVNEMLIVENPSDRAWIGPASQADRKDERITVTLPMPSASEPPEVREGFDPCCTRFEKGSIIGTRPLLPGRTQFHYGYPVAVAGGKGRLILQAPADIEQLAVIVPDEPAIKVAAQGLDAGKAVEFEKHKLRLFRAEKIKAGRQVVLDFAGLAAGGPAPAGKKGAGSSSLPETLAAVGGGAILVLGLGVLLARSARKGAQARPAGIGDGGPVKPGTQQA